MLNAAALSLVGLTGEEEAPRLRLGPRSSAPRPVAMHRLLDRLLKQRKCSARPSPHVIQISRCATRLTSPVIRFPGVLDVLIIDDAAQYLALAPHRASIKANRMKFATLPTKLSCPNGAKKIFKNFSVASQKTKTPLDRAAHSYPLKEKLHQAIAFMRALRRDTRRAAAFLAITRLAPPRWMSG